MDGFDNQGRKGTAFASEKLGWGGNRASDGLAETMLLAGCLLGKRV